MLLLWYDTVTLGIICVVIIILNIIIFQIQPDAMIFENIFLES